MKSLNEILTSLEGLSDIELFAIDLFCGAGGMSEGIEESRIDGSKCAKVVCCVNHDKNAILSHDANIPDALHFIEDIRILNLDPVIIIVNYIRQLYPDAKIMLHASLECTNFSKAKGGQSRDADSRTLAEHLFRYINVIDPDYIQIENVEEFMTWGPLIVKTSRTKEDLEFCPCNLQKEKVKVKRGEKKCIKWQLSAQMIPDPKKKGIYYHKWVDDVKKHGYEFEKRILNSADFGARTARKRFFGIFAKRGLPIVFPEPTHSKEGTPGLFDKKKKWLPVKDVLDFSDEGKSIFDRKKPLADKTLRRHHSGLVKFVAGGKDAYLIKWNSMNINGIYHAPDVDAPCPVVSCQNRLGLANVSFLSKYYSGHPDSKNISITGPAHTIKCKDNHSLVTADFISAYYGTGDNVSSIDAPSPTVSTKDRLSIVSPFFFSNYYSGGGQHSDLNSPCPTILANPKQSLISCHFFDMQYGSSRGASIEKPAGSIVANPKYSPVICNRWLMNTNYGNIGSKLTDPAPTITANRKWHYLVNPQYQSAGGDVNKPCFTIIARMDKMPPGLATCETVPSGKIPSFIKITPDGVIYEIYDTDSPVLVEIKEFMALYGIIDIKMRMLKIPELKQIMGFPKGYILKGTQAEQKKFIGNAVEVKQARKNTEAICKKLREMRLKRTAA